MNRKIYYWKLRDSEMQLGERTLIMGVLNITPDSFSDGGRFNDPERAYARALELEEQGADIIDIGAESTKPGSQRITADEEWQRLVPVLKRLRGNLRVPLSLDTYKSEIAERALEYGVEIFNDPSGLTIDPNLAKVAANGNAGLILNHMRGLPETWAKQSPMKDLLATIGRELEATASRARHAGVERGRIIIDPGLGFGKRKEQNAEILAHLQQLAALDYPILVGPSRKSFLAQPSETGTLYATAAAVSAAVLNGAHIVRVHDVKEMQTVVLVAEEIARASMPKPGPEVEPRLVVRAHTRTGPNLESEKPRPTRPPIAKPVVVVPPVVAPVVDTAAVATPSIAEEPILAEAAPEAQAPTEPVVEKRPEPAKEKAFEERPRKAYARPKDEGRRDEGRDNRREFRPPSRPPYADRDQRDPRDGSRPPSRSAPPRGRDFRPGQGAAAGNDRFKPSGFKPSGFKPSGPSRPFGDRPPRRNDDERPPRRNDRDEFRPAARSGPPGRSGPPRSGPPRFRSDDDRPRSGGFKPAGSRPSGPPRSFDRGGDSREGRPQGRPERGSGPPRSFGPPRSGPPRDDRPGSAPPKRPFRKRP